MPAKWLKDTIFYEIYPQSFYDSNGDGIGDINGIAEKLDYIKGLGCNALWINPCFDSPFKDAGYDVRDYKLVAPRYGTNEDLFCLFSLAHEKGIRVLLDLVAGHTSEEHPWFLASQKAEENEYSDRYIWTDFCFQRSESLPCINGESERSAAYIINFFKCQPALNYGFLHPKEDWQQPYDGPAALKTREALKDVMRFWLDHGCDGFRVDMAGSLVKLDDEAFTGTSAVWHDIRAMLDREYPEAALVAEWNNPAVSLAAGFDMDFYLNHPGNGYYALLRDPEKAYFKKEGGGDIRLFLKEYCERYTATCGKGYICLPTCNHDTVRLAPSLDERERLLAYAFIFTMPGVPFLYYGDEIGMRYLDLPTKEGGYFRTGSRSPMQWDKGRNLGFSAAAADALYLPVDSAPDAPAVREQEDDPASFLNQLRQILSLRHAQPDLQADAPFVSLCAEPGKPFVYRRGGLLCAVNPAGEGQTVSLAEACGEALFVLGAASVRDGKLTMGAQSFAVFPSTGGRHA